MQAVEKTRIGNVALAYRMRPGSSRAVIFIHGLGDSQSSFSSFFEKDLPDDLTLAALDMPGCGKSDRPTDFSYAMKDQADLVLKWLREFGFEKTILAGHSMGGVIAQYVAESLPPERIEGFVNIEGNLGIEDCFFSGRIASYSESAFEKNGFKSIVRALRAGTASDPSSVMKQYLDNFSKALPRAVYRSSLSLIEESTHGRLKERFSALAFPKGFISGERSLTPSLSDYLERNRILHLTVPASGHFMMLEQPEAFHEIFWRMLERMRGLRIEPSASSGQGIEN